MRKLVPVIVVFAIAAIANQRSGRHQAAEREAPAAEQLVEREEYRTTVSDTSRFHCDGRTHCSEMSSCAEATYFLENCPGTKMDGDRDGIPCEDQHCGHRVLTSAP